MLANRVAAVVVALVVCGAAAAQPAPSADASPSIVLGAPGRAPISLSAADLAQLPTEQVATSFRTEHGTRSASFTGPLLWAVLTKAGAIDPAKPRDAVRQALLVTGSDGYVALIGMGEIAPDFEGKQVILAMSADGKPLEAGHLRLVLPADKRGGRSVRDVARIDVVSPEPQRP
jgi:DMSO/TMAO reductase YedYZ molybdopterin-dependent catalytic subunit